MLKSRAVLPTRVVCASSNHKPPVASSQAMPLRALVYSGPGAGFRSALSAVHSLRDALSVQVKVEQLSPEELLASGWQEGCLVLVMPGGADLPYCRVLNGRGNALIQEYVEGGGAYLGLCAGAYYGCARVEFEPGTRLEVVGDRELAFFPGVARGSIYQGFRYESEAGAAAVPLWYLDVGASPEAPPITAAAAPTAAAAEATAAAAEAVTAAAEPAAAVEDSSKRPAAASGAGAEASAADGAGAGGAAAGTACLAPPVPQQHQQRQLQQRQPQQQQEGKFRGLGLGPLPGSPFWRQCQDYINGGPGFFSKDGRSLLQRPPPGVAVLATYPGRGHAAAAVLCEVAQGRAVLCGTHPELHPSWLEPCLAAGGGPGAASACSDRAVGREEPLNSPGSSGNGSGQRELREAAAAAVAAAPAGAPAAAGSREDEVAQNVRRVHAALVAGQGERERYWRALLGAAGLGAWLRQGRTGEVVSL